MSIIDDVKIHQDWGKDGYVFEKVKEKTLGPTLKSLGLLSAAQVAQNDLLAGVIENITTVNYFL